MLTDIGGNRLIFSIIRIGVAVKFQFSIAGVVCQKQLSRVGTSKYIPQILLYSVGITHSPIHMIELCRHERLQHTGFKIKMSSWYKSWAYYISPLWPISASAPKQLITVESPQ